MSKPSAPTFDSGNAISVPAAACPRCGGWTSYGGMSQFYQSKVPVHGRLGCPGPHCAPVAR